jgi:TetR/AcrR family transcriptional repressor of bet genes
MTETTPRPDAPRSSRALAKAGRRLHLIGAVPRHLADEPRAPWQSRVQGPDAPCGDLLRDIAGSRLHPAIRARRKLAVWRAFRGDACARDIHRRAVGDADDDRLHAGAALIAEMAAEAGYPGIDPEQSVLTVKALHDGFWLNLLLYPAGFRRPACLDRALRMMATLFPKHFAPSRADAERP